MHPNPAFTNADYVAFVFILIGTIVGFRRGMTGHIGFLLVTLIVIATAVNGYTPVHDWLATQLTLTPQRLCLASLLIVILAPLFVASIAGKLMGHAMQITFVRWIDRLGGALCGFVNASAFVALTFIVASLPPEHLRPPGIGPDSWIGSHIVVAESQIEDRIESGVKMTREDLRKVHESHVRSRGEEWLK